MERYSRIKLTKLINDLQIPVFNLKTLKQYLGINSDSGLYLIIKELTTHQVITELKPGFYFANNNQPDHNTIANLLISPSYVSLETVLSLNNILSQIPLVTTSITLKKPTKVKTTIGEFFYSKITPKLFFGYHLVNNYLIADPEKAILDYIYLSCQKGYELNLDEWDFDNVDNKKLNAYLKLLRTSRYYSSVYQVIKEQTPCLL